MSNNPFFTDATTIASVTAVTALLTNGYLEIYNGTQPTDANTAVGAQVLLSGGMQFAAGHVAMPSMTMSGAVGLQPAGTASVMLPTPSISGTSRNYKMYFWRAPDRLDLTGGTITGVALPDIDDEAGAPITDEAGSPLNAEG